MDLDRSTGGGIAFDDKVLREDAAASVRTCRVWPTVEVAIWGLHLGAASAQLRAARLDQKRSERATRGALIGEEARQDRGPQSVVTKKISPRLSKVEMSFCGAGRVWRGRAESSDIGDLPRHLCGFRGATGGAFVAE